MLTQEKKRRIQQSLKSLADAHASAVAQIEAAMADLEQMLDLDDLPPAVTNEKPLADRGTFSVIWKGESCFLDNTLVFALFERLLQSVNRYVSYYDLMEDVWGGPRHATTVRGVAKRLKDQLMSSGMEGLIYRCVIGSRAYGLEDEASDTDRRGIYLPSADLHWSLFGVPEQLENNETQEVYWELQKFIVLALKANPNVLECLHSPLVESSTPLGEELLEMRSAFLSKLIFQTFSGYVASQFKKMQTDIRNQGRVKWKHVMHLIRLLLSGTHVLRSGEMMVDVGQDRDQLLMISMNSSNASVLDQRKERLKLPT